MNLSSLLENERRARLAAERLLEMRQGELREANRKLARHARSLTSEIMEKRGEVEQIRTTSQSLRGEFDQTRADLARAQRAAETAETMLWSALQSVRDGFAMFDAEHRLIVANKAYLSIFDGLECMKPGIHYHDVVDLLLNEGIVDPQGPPDPWRAQQKARWDSAQPEDAVLKLWNGQFVKLLDRRMPDGGIVTLGINQTESLRTRAAVEAIPDGFVVFDQDDKLVMCNQRYLDVFPEQAASITIGTSFEEVLRLGLKNGQYQDAIGREEQWLETRLNEHRRGDVTFEQPIEDDRWLRIIERVTPDGGRVGLRVDITETKRHQADLERERARAEAANQAKSNFLANMSHEIRTPMNGVIGMADMLCEGPLSAEQRVCADTIRSCGEALLDILNDILDFTKIETGHMTLKSAAFDIERCVHGVARLLQPTLRAPDLLLLVDVDRKTAPHVIGDEGRVRQILTNLVGNAAKFTETGHILIRVRRETPDEADPPDLVIEVEDTGIGIPADKIDHVFGAFNQVDTGRDRRFDGTGLGLAITRQLVQQMGGEITATSSVGAGSTFRVRLPLAPAPGPFRPLRAPGDPVAWIVGPHSRATELLSAQLSAIGATTRRAPPDAWPDAVGETDVVFAFARPDAAPPAGARIVFVVAGARDPRPGTGDAISLPISRQTLFDTLIGIAPGEQVAPPPTREEPVEPAGDPPRPLRVLAAEDNKTNRIVLEKMLKTANITLHVVGNGREAVEAYVADPPDLVLMDISMPLMDGREATRRIRAHEVEKGLPRVAIHAMTAHALAGDVEESLAAGIDSHLTKPLSRAKLVDTIEAVRDRIAAQAGPEDG